MVTRARLIYWTDENYRYRHILLLFIQSHQTCISIIDSILSHMQQSVHIVVKRNGSNLVHTGVTMTEFI